MKKTMLVWGMMIGFSQLLADADVEEVPAETMLLDEVEEDEMLGVEEASATSAGASGENDLGLLDEDEAAAYEQPEAVEEVINDLLAELEKEEKTDASELLEYHCLDDLLKKGPHKESPLLALAKRLGRAGVGLVASMAVHSGIESYAKTFSDNHPIVRNVFLASLVISVYEYLAGHLPENVGVYRSILTHIVQHWNLYHLLIPEEYIGPFNTLHAAYLQNGHDLALSEKEAKHFVRVIKYDVRREIKKRERRRSVQAQ